MNKKEIHQNLMRTAVTLAGMNMTRWAVTLAVVMITMLALPTGAWAQQGTGENYTIPHEGDAPDTGAQISGGSAQINGISESDIVQACGGDDAAAQEGEGNNGQGVASEGAQDENGPSQNSTYVTPDVKPVNPDQPVNPSGGDGSDLLSFTPYNIPFTIALYDNGQQTENNAVGTASADPACVDKAGIQVTITAAANEGYKFKEWQTPNPQSVENFSLHNYQSSLSFNHPGGLILSFTAVFEVDPNYQGGSGQSEQGGGGGSDVQPESQGPEYRTLSLGEGWNAYGATVTASYIIDGMDEAELITENLTKESAAPLPEGSTVSLTIMPGEGYVVDEVSVSKVEGEAFVIGGGSRTRGGGVGAVVVSHTDGTNVWSFTMPAYNAKATVTYKQKTAPKKTLESSWITLDLGKNGLTYNGEEQKPGVTVTDGGTDITDEFVITYNNNKSAGEATVTVTAKSTSTGYTGTATATFTIAPKPVTVVSGLTVSSATINSIKVYYVDASHAIINGAVDNDKLSITNVVARLQNGSTEICNLEYTNATILLGEDQANNYVVAEQGNQPSAPITVSTETVTEADGSQTIKTSKTPDLDVSEVYSIAADGKGTVTSGNGGGDTPTGLYNRIILEIQKIFDALIKNAFPIDASSQLLISGDDAPNILVNTTTKKDVEGNTEAPSASITIKQNRSADASGDVNTNKSTKIAVGNNLGKYMFHVNISGHGTLSVSPASANMGDWVTITVNPDNGYKLEKLYVIDGGSHSTEETAIRPTRSPSDPNQYTFQIPFTEGWTASSTGLNINASFVADGTGGGGDGENPESQNTTTSGTFGNFIWEVSKSDNSSVFDVLTISGSGKMETGNESPWSAYNTQIKTVIIDEGVTCIGNNVFAGYTGDHVYIIVPEEKILSVRFDLNKSPELIRPTSGQVDIIEHLFANPSDRTSSLALMVDDVYPQLKEGDTFTLASEDTEAPKTVSIQYKCYNKKEKYGKILWSEEEVMKDLDNREIGNISMMVDATVTAELVAGTTDTYKVTENKATKLTLLGIPSNIINGDTYFYRPQNISFEGADIDIQNINLVGVTLEKGDKICLIRDFGKTVGNITGSKSPNNGYIYHAYLQASEPSYLIFEIDSRYEEQEPSTQDLNDQAATTMIVQYDTKKVTGGADVNPGDNVHSGDDVHPGAVDISGGKSKVTANKKSLGMKGGTVNRIIGGGTRAATAEPENDEIEIVSGQEYKILHDGYIILNFYTPDGSITVNSIIIRRPGDANNDGYLNAADLVEMVNAKNDKASERFNLTNADINLDGIITQDDIDFVVKLIMEQMDEE